MNISDQDQNIVFQDSVRQTADTSLKGTFVQANSVKSSDSVRIKQKFLLQDNSGSFPFNFIKENARQETESRQLIEKNLRNGRGLPSNPFHSDWIILVVVIVIFLYGLIQTVSRKTILEVTGFFNFRSIGDPVSRDTGGLFHWESTLINAVSFINIALFAYCGTVYYEVSPSWLSGIKLWLILLGIIIVIITIRHFVCLVTGNISGEKEAFNEYLVTIYQSYRFLALLLFFLVILISYTNLFPEKTLLLAGSILYSSVYLIRIIRLLFIFLNRNISISYLILYLCALEFLPVVISVKYFTGLF